MGFFDLEAWMWVIMPTAFKSIKFHLSYCVVLYLALYITPSICIIYYLQFIFNQNSIKFGELYLLEFKVYLLINLVQT